MELTRETKLSVPKVEIFTYDEGDNTYKPISMENGIPVRIIGGDGGIGGTSMSFISGTVAPTTEGIDGDVYLNTSNGNIYKKNSGTWSLLMNIKGAKGDKGDTGATGATGTKGTDGATWLLGAVAPTTEGKTGDLYLNTANSDVYSKATGAWVKTGNIKGATGTTGAKGDKGDKGDKGADGFGTQAQYDDIIARLTALENTTS